MPVHVETVLAREFLVVLLRLIEKHELVIGVARLILAIGGHAAARIYNDLVYLGTLIAHYLIVRLIYIYIIQLSIRHLRRYS